MGKEELNRVLQRLYAKMIQRTEELSDDMHENFIATLVFEEEAKMIEGEAKEAGQHHFINTQACFSHSSYAEI